jgi:hypothetical protein
MLARIAFRNQESDERSTGKSCRPVGACAVDADPADLWRASAGADRAACVLLWISAMRSFPTRIRSPRGSGSRLRLAAPHDEPSLVDAVERAFEAGQQLMADRVELLRLDAMAAARRLGGSLAVLVLGIGAVLFGWCALMAAFALWEGGPIATVWGRLGVIGAAHLLAGGAIIAAAIRSERRRAGAGVPS